MGLFDFFRKTSKSSTETRSKYENLPLVNPQEDKQAPKGYVERKFITEEKLYEKCNNIFAKSNIPIVNKCEYATRYIGTMVLQNPNGQKVRSVTEIIFYSIPNELQQEYMQLVAQLNNLIIKYELPKKYLFPLDKIAFNPSSNGGYDIPLSCIQYNQEKQEFYFIFKNEICEKGPYKYSTPIYESTHVGSITFSEDGTMKKAEYNLPVKGIDAKIKFKNYKSGFDLYDIRYNGDIIYKRH